MFGSNITIFISLFFLQKNGMVQRFLKKSKKVEMQSL
jgi:hypothetical protein